MLIEAMQCSNSTSSLRGEIKCSLLREKNASLEPILAPERGARSDTPIEVPFRDKIIPNYYEFS